ncbi:MAG: hypothetical protein K1X57_03355 [Gemmataceae bacterium]|nr:hypothetical protein [Gemmataceae bacterium]
MPVRFRCVYCNQLLAIAHRKVGSVVRCTSCEGQIIVPEPEAVLAAGAGNGPAPERSLLEQNDLDALLTPTPELARPSKLTADYAETSAIGGSRLSKAVLLLSFAAFAAGLVLGILIDRLLLG